MHNVAQRISTPKSSCKADISYLLNGNTPLPLFPAHGSHNSTDISMSKATLDTSCSRIM